LKRVLIFFVPQRGLRTIGAWIGIRSGVGALSEPGFSGTSGTSGTSGRYVNTSDGSFITKGKAINIPQSQKTIHFCKQMDFSIQYYQAILLNLFSILSLSLKENISTPYSSIMVSTGGEMDSKS